MGNIGKAVVGFGYGFSQLANTTSGMESVDFNVVDDLGQINENRESPPRNIEVIKDDQGLFGVLHPSKQYTPLNNRMVFSSSGGNDALANEVEWTPLHPIVNEFADVEHIDVLFPEGNNMDAPPEDQANPPSDYHGPLWRIVWPTKQVLNQGADVPKDLSGSIQDASAGNGVSADDLKSDTTDLTSPQNISVVEQFNIFDGIWWGIQSDPELAPNLPFWLDINRLEPKPIRGQSTFIVIRINQQDFAVPGEADGSFDIIIEENKNPRIYDWGVVSQEQTSGGSDVKPLCREFPIGSLPSSGPLRIGFLPVCGRLAIYFNNQQILYSRLIPTPSTSTVGRQGSVDSFGNVTPGNFRGNSNASVVTQISNFSIAPFVFQASSIQVYGTNSVAQVNMSAMSFATARIGLPFTGRADPKTGSASAPWGSSLWRVPLALQQGTSGNTVDDFGNNTPGNFGGSGTKKGNTQISGFGISYAGIEDDLQGDSFFDSIDYVGYGWVKTALGPPKTDGTTKGKDRYYYARLIPTMHPFGPSYDATGEAQKAGDAAGADAAVNAYDEAINNGMSDAQAEIEGEMAFADAYDSAYSDSIQNSNLLAIGSPFIQRFYQDVQIQPPSSSSFNQSQNQIMFNGIDASTDVLSATDTYSCQDHNVVSHTAEVVIYNPNHKYDDLLNKCYNVQLSMGWNSPTVVFTGVSCGGTSSLTPGKETITITCEDYMSILESTLIFNCPYYDGNDAFDVIQSLAGRANITCVDDTTGPRYYVPSGYSWTQPKMKFQATTPVKHAISEVCKLFELITYFDENGIMHLDNLQGTITGEFSSTTHGVLFSRDPTGDDFNVILNEKKIDSKIMSAVNKVIIETVDRLNGSVVLVSKAASSSQNKFPFNKVFYMQQPALGSQAAANLWATKFITLLARTPSGMSFSTVLRPGAIIRPTDVIRVDGTLMRVTSLSRQFNAEDNSLQANLSCEWWT